MQGKTVLRFVMAAAATSAGLALASTSAADASSIPVLVQWPAECPDPPLVASAPRCPTTIKPRWWTWTGDGSAVLYDLHWKTWVGRGADATGTLVDRTGPGDSANQRQPVVVSAVDPAEFQGHYVYTVVNVTSARLSANGQDFFWTVAAL